MDDQELACRYDRSLGVFDGYWWRCPDEYEAQAAIVRRRTKLFAEGDVVFSMFMNGQARRWGFSGHSSKRRALIHGVYLQFGRWGSSEDDRAELARMKRTVEPLPPQERALILYTPQSVFHDNRTVVRTIARPDALATLSWKDPVVRRFALSALRAAYAACPVSTDSGDCSRTEP